MKIKALMCVLGLIAAGTAAAHGDNNGRSGILFVFDGAIIDIPVRSGGAAAPAAPNLVAGVTPGGAPWGMTSFQAILKNTGDIRARGTGVLLLGTDNLGTRGGPRQVVLTLFCRNAPVPPAVAGSLNTANPFHSAPVDLDEDGDFSVRSKLTDATGATPPLDCGDTVDNRPVLLVRNWNPANATTGAPAAPGPWFAAGVIAPKWSKGRWKYWD
jgi:hypothetical protein